MTPTDNYCVIYCRVSSKTQEEQGLSLDAQDSLLSTWARDNGFLVVKKFKVQESATKSDRKGLRKLLRFCEDNGINNILVEKLDRLNRDDPEVDVLIEKYRKNGFKFYLIKDNEILDKNLNAKKKFVYKVMKAMAGFTVDNLAEESLKGTLERLKRRKFKRNSGETEER